MKPEQETNLNPPDRETAKRLFAEHRTERDGIRDIPAMAYVCLICGSVHVAPLAGNDKKRVCLDCGFAFYRYQCKACGTPIDGRDPANPICPTCHNPTCTCGACGCRE